MRLPELDPGLLPTYLAVLEHGRISAAARAVHLSQPAVTARMKRLEESIGVPLLIRSVHGVTPTPAGERLAAYARRVDALLTDAISEIGGTRQRLGRLRLIASTTIAAHVLPPVLARFRARYPDVRMEIEIGNTEDVIAAIRAGDFPLGLVEGHARAAGVRLEPWVDDELVPVVGARSPWRPRDVSELEHVPMLWREAGSGTRQVVARALREAGVRHRPSARDLVLGANESIAGAAAAGLGLAFLSRWGLGPRLAAGQLRAVPALELTIQRSFHWAKPAAAVEGAAAHFLAFGRRHPPSPH
ncbi:MAG: LysR substrate-binding domain-containing protein [Planctomycetota bacterium]